LILNYIIDIVIGILQLPKAGVTITCVARVFVVTEYPANNCVAVKTPGETVPTSAVIKNVGPRFGFNGEFNVIFTN
jgi:hypothetical protein